MYPSVLGKKIYRCPRGFLLDYKDKIDAFALKYKIDVRVAVNVE